MTDPSDVVANVEDLAPVAGSLMAPEDALDKGAAGLKYFEQFLPAARRIGIENREYLDYCAQFDVERGMDIRTLEGDVDDVRAAAAAARSAAEEHRDAVSALSSSWWDGAGEEAVAFGSVIRDRAAESAEQLTAAADAFGELPATLRQAVQTKAFEVASLYEATVAGYCARQVDVLVEIGELTAESYLYQAERLITEASNWFPSIAAAVGSGSVEATDVRATVADIARKWLHESFAPCYARVRDLFDEACERCAETVRSAYRAVSDEAQKVSVDPFPVPGELSSPAPSGIPAASAPARPEVGAPVSTPPPAPAVPVQGDPAAATGSSSQGTPRSSGSDVSGEYGAQAGSTAPQGYGSSPGYGQQNYGGQPGYGGQGSYDTAPGNFRGGGYGDLSAIGPLPGNDGLSGLIPNGIPGTGGLGDLGSIGGGLSGLLGEVRSLVEPVIDDVVSALTSHGEDDVDHADGDVDDTVSDTSGDETAESSADSAESDDVKSLELKSDGKTWTLALDEESKGVSLQIDDGHGESTKYAIELGPDGVPRIVVEDMSDGESGEAGVVATDTSVGEAGRAIPEEAPISEESVSSEGDSDETRSDETRSDVIPEEASVDGPPADEAPIHEAPVYEGSEFEVPVPDQSGAEPELASVSPDPGTESTDSSVRDAGSSEEPGDSGAELAEAGPL